MQPQPWEPYKALARAKMRQIKTNQQREQHSASPITDSLAPRTWKAEERCTEEQLDATFLLLEDYGPQSQEEIANELSDLFGLKVGTARGATSGALFTLQEWGLVEWTGDKKETDNGGRSRIWRIKSD